MILTTLMKILPAVRSTLMGSAVAALALRFVVSRPLWVVGLVVRQRIISQTHQALLDEHDSFKRYCNGKERRPLWNGTVLHLPAEPMQAR